jgi:hypothetical protein
MRVSLKTAVITGEVTVLVAFTGVGIHLFMQPHHFAQAPPPLVLPSGGATRSPSQVGPSPRGAAPAARPSASASPSRELAPGWISQLNRDDRSQLRTEWEILRRLTKTVEQFLEQRVVPAMEGRS